MKQISRTIIAGVASATLAVSMLTPFAAFAISSDDLFGGAGKGTTIATELGAKPDQDITVTVAKIVRQFLGLLGIVAVVIVLIGGFEWMTAGGNEENVGKAKKRIMQGVIGLALILSAFAVAQFVVTALSKAVS